MFKELLTHLLCIVFVFTSSFPVLASGTESAGGLSEQHIRSQYPNARIVHVEPEDYPKLATELSSRGYVAANQQHLDEAQDAPLVPERRSAEKDCDKSGRSDTGPVDDDGSFQVIVDATDDILRSGDSSGSSEGAVLVFVIIGAVVIVVWALYVLKYVYDLALGFEPCGRWSELTFISSSISSDSTQHIDLNGLRLMTGFRDGMTDVGIAVELGQADILLTEASALELQGVYWFLGPVLRWRFSEGNNPHYFQMNFMGGSTEHDEIGVIARASLGLRFGLGDHMHFGISWGAMNVRLNNDQGIITERDQYHYLYGVNAGFSF